MWYSQFELTVSHLPISTSFFLSVLRPLGYRYIDQRDHQIAIGVMDAEFFLAQDMSGTHTRTSHITFSAPSESVVREFYKRALKAGGVPHGLPTNRNYGGDCFNAAVLDLDGNSIEVLYHQDDIGLRGSAQSRVLRWNNHAEGNLDKFIGARNLNVDGLTTVAASAAASALLPAMIDPGLMGAEVGSRMSKPLGSRSSVSTVLAKSANRGSELALRRDVIENLQKSLTNPSGSTKLIIGDQKMEISTRTLVGTMIGAAAGAAVAYAMCKSEEDSARAEGEAYRSSMLLESNGKKLESSERRKSLPLESSPPISRPRNISSQPSSRRYSSGAFESPQFAYPGFARPPLRTLPPMKAIDYMPASTGRRLSMRRAGTMPYPSIYELPADPRSQSPYHRPYDFSANRRSSLSADQRRASSTYGRNLPPVKRRSEVSRSRSVDGHQDYHFRNPGDGSYYGRNYLSDPRLTRQHSSKASRDMDVLERNITRLDPYNLNVRGLRNALLEDTGLDMEPPNPPDDHAAYLAEQDELETLVPSDSISCAGYRSLATGRRSSHRSRDGRVERIPESSSKSRPHQQKKSHDRPRRKLEVVRPDSISEGESEVTITRRYNEGNILSLPIRSIGDGGRVF